jgi:hypothetical protein
MLGTNSNIYQVTDNMKHLHIIIKASTPYSVFMLYFAAVTILLVEETNGCLDFIRVGHCLLPMLVYLKCFCFWQPVLKWVMTDVTNLKNSE